MAAEFFKRITTILNPFASETERLAAKGGLKSPREIDFEIRMRLAESTFKKAEEGEMGINWFEGGWSPIVGVVIAARNFGPDVAASAIEKGFAKLSDYSREQIAETVKNLNLQAAEEGWRNSNLEPFQPGTVYQKVQIYKL